jgi:ABC-type multidrug transport system ATPase subunit
MEFNNLILEDLEIYVSKKYDGSLKEVKLFNKLNLVLEPGERVIFFDENGRGKSLLLDLIFFGYTKELISRGEGLKVLGKIHFKGNNILIPNKLSSPIALLTQNPYTRKGYTALEEIKSTCIGYGLDLENNTNEFDRLKRYLKMFNLIEKKDYVVDDDSFFRSSSRLSFGEVKLFSIIAKMMITPYVDILLLDEPLNHISYENAKTINFIFDEIILTKPDLIVIVVSHCKSVGFVNKQLRFNYKDNNFEVEKFKPYECFLNLVNETKLNFNK